MFMDFSEFRRRVWAEPRSGDPDLLAARAATPEHEAEAREAERFEDRLERACAIDPRVQGIPSSKGTL